jgi:tRNA 5-methylaminomethyl-2-thiouridine biosynthesis bifunctional protein
LSFAPDWAFQPSHTVLNTEFGQGQHFLATWHAWQTDPRRSNRLHYVAVALALDVPAIGRLLAHPALATQLLAQLWGMSPGIHRISLNQDAVLLTLAVPKPGEALQDLLQALVFQAHTVWVSQPLPANSLKALARHCQRGTRLGLPACDPATRQALNSLGFEVGDASEPTTTTAIYNPRWELRRQPYANTPAQHAVVLGAGLSGAAVAYSLARRGWQVQVLDAAPGPAQGASSLPVGLLVPHVSPDDAPLSRASRAGLRATLHAAHTLLNQGSDWQPTPTLREGTLLPYAAWIKPGALVRAWLKHHRICFTGGRAVASVRCVTEGALPQWQALDAAGQVLAQAPLMVLCTAYAVTELLPAAQFEQTLDQVAGQVAHGPWTAALAHTAPPHPVSGHGHFIPAVPGVPGAPGTPGTPGAHTAFWLSGSTYERAALHTLNTAAGLLANQQRLHTLLHQARKLLDAQFSSGQVQHWAAQRCTSRDRFPLVGQWLPGLHISTAMGSRGLSFAALSAELLAAHLHAEPLPLEARLARAFDAKRGKV